MLDFLCGHGHQQVGFSAIFHVHCLACNVCFWAVFCGGTMKYGFAGTWGRRICAVGLLLGLSACIGDNDGAPEEEVTLFALGGQYHDILRPSLDRPSEYVEEEILTEPTTAAWRAMAFFEAQGIPVHEGQCALAEPRMGTTPPGVIVAQVMPAPHFLRLFKTSRSMAAQIRGWHFDPESQQRFLVDELGNPDQTIDYPFDSPGYHQPGDVFLSVKYVDCDDLRRRVKIKALPY
ncbi:MAG: hypothetical protein LWW81_16935 [Rhodocyclales bacterium]|nr:hypothetical protein [Rhodocyclales bacterium]